MLFASCQFRTIAELVQRLRIRQCRGVCYRPAFDRVAHRKFGNLAAAGAWDGRDLEHAGGDMAGCQPGADLGADVGPDAPSIAVVGTRVAALGRSLPVPLNGFVARVGEEAVASARNIMGATNPANAAPGSIRGDLASLLTENIVHGSDSVESAQRELSTWF